VATSGQPDAPISPLDVLSLLVFEPCPARLHTRMNGNRALMKKGENVRVERLPFTVYDILGYFIPGFLFLAGVTHFFPAVQATVDSHMLRLGSGLSGQAIGLGMVIAASYAAGHIVSFVASYTVEKGMIGINGYPSEYLMDNEGFKRRWYHHEALGKLAQQRIAARFQEEFNASLNDYERRDWFQLIDHYHRANSPQIAARTYNYVVLFGFLRNTAFVLYALGGISLLSITWCPPNASSFIPLSLVFFGVLATLGFQKYFRRYSSQTLLGFAVSKPEPDDRDEKGD
jgi:hypothetical protein